MFLALQDQMAARLNAARIAISHPTAIGTAAEINWRQMLEDYLPSRYKVSDGFVVDAEGLISRQIDVVIFDRQYSPFIFNQDNTFYIPAESVYAVFEVRPELNRENTSYAGAKATSVRRLRRTSAPIPHAGGIFEPKPLYKIIGGVLAARSEWNPPFGAPFKETLAGLPAHSRLDLGCVLDSGGFQVTYQQEQVLLETSDQESALIFFFIRLLGALQSLGTAPAIDFREYGRNIWSPSRTRRPGDDQGAR
jgi:hypothetical protein